VPLADATARLKAMADPLRIRLGMLLLEGGRTVKELATALDVPPTRLYYHVRILEEHGLIEVVDRRMVSGIEERRYGIVEGAWAFEPDTNPTARQTQAAISAVLGAVQAQIEVALHEGPDGSVGDALAAVPVFTLTDLALTQDEMAEVERRLQGIQEDFGRWEGQATPPNAQRYHFLFAGYLRPGGARAS
jgi:DNA-binding transcriptional ArsR family regulator